MTAVLVVDDDRAILDGIRRSLRGRLPEVDLHLAEGGAEACARLRGDPVDVVMTDLRMPGVDGVEVLAVAREVQPHAARAVLSGWVDEADTLRSLQFAHRCLSKPVTPGRLLSTLRALLDAVADVPAPLRSCLGRLVSLPSRRTTLQAVRCQLAGSAPMRAVASMIEGDTALSLMVLHVAVRVDGDDATPLTVAEAVSRLGTTTLQRLAEKTAVLDDRWTQRGWAATAAEVLGDFVPSVARTSPSALAGAAGVLSMAACRPDLMRQLLASTGAAPEALAAAERATMGVSHEELGAALLGMWGITWPDAPGGGHELAAALTELAALARATQPGRRPPSWAAVAGAGGRP